MRTVGPIPSAFLLLGLLFILAVSLPAGADSIELSVTGFGYLGANSEGLSVGSGKYFSMYSAAPDGPAWLDRGVVGQPMSLTIIPTAYSGFGTDVRIGGSVTDILQGSIAIDSTFTVPASALYTGSFTAPVTVVGTLQAFTDLTYGTGIITRGPLLGTFDFFGKGTGYFHIQNEGEGDFLIFEENATFSGTGTLNTSVQVTPEPTSLIFVGTGLAGVGLSLRLRGRSHSTTRRENGISTYE